MPAKMRAFRIAAGVLALLGVFAYVVRAQEDQPPKGPEVTIIGNVLCQRAFVPPMGVCGRNSKYVPVVVALDGPPEIKAEVARLMKEYWPANNTLDFDQAQKLNDAWCASLTYIIAPYPGRDKLHHEIEYGSRNKAVTGVVYEKDGKKWILPSKVEPGEWGDVDYTKCVPAQMLLPDKPLVKAGDKSITIQVTDALSLKCILIPAGKFLMGSPFYQIRYQDEFPHEVTLTKSFYMSEIPITQEMFEAVMKKNPSGNKGPQFPVESVPYADIQEFCRIVSEKNQRKVRLPTDAEFEYAARVGTSSPNFDEKYKAQFSYVGVKAAEGIPSQPVKTKQPNAWGLYDMLTCGWHTLGDFKTDNFREKQVDPTGPRGERDAHVQRFEEKDGSSGPLYKSRGGWYYGKVRPNQHGANKSNGGYYEGTPLFRVVVEAAPVAAAPAPGAAAN
jgi:formylglycine-generating enzyme required for sulfatase activity